MSHSANMQTLVLSRLTQMLKDNGIDGVAANSVLDRRGERRFTIDYGASNTGTIRIIEGYTLRELASITFDFQRDNFRFGGNVNPVAAHYYGRARKPSNSPWVYSTPLDALVAVRSHLLKQVGTSIAA